MAPPGIFLTHARRRIQHPPFQLAHLLSSIQSHSASSIGELGFSEPPLGFPFFSFLRSLCSSAPIKPVSYPIKPKDDSAADQEPPSPPKVSPSPRRTQRDLAEAGSQPTETETHLSSEAVPRPWTRADARYVKDVPVIAPVSYPTKVAPLPEDRVSVPGEEGKEGERGVDEQMQRESRRIEAETRVRRAFRVEEEEVKVPFPTLIKAEKKPTKVVLDLQEAISEVKANARRNFTETVEAHVNLGVDPRRSDQMVRGAVTLPHGTGKVVRVAVFAEGAAADEARAAGADLVGGDELIEEIKNGGGKLNFDKCIATPIFMPRLGKIARILGPRGMMPNPKLGSVTSDVSGAVQDAKRGRIDFKIDKTAIVHVGLGKVSFSEEALRENVGAFVNALLLAKPVGLKKTSKYAGYVNKFSLCSTIPPVFNGKRTDRGGDRFEGVLQQHYRVGVVPLPPNVHNKKKGLPAAFQ